MSSAKHPKPYLRNQKVKSRIVLGLTAFLMTFNSTVVHANLTGKSLSGAGNQIVNLGEAGDHPWTYNPGPNPNTAEGKEVIDLGADLSEYSFISSEIMDEQKFRYAYGNMITRARFEQNTTKIFFLGQDATHIAEASKQPGTSGFGGRVQSVANFFGVNQSVATSNAFFSTIKGQYGSFGHLYVEIDESGQAKFKQSSFVDNQLWTIANDPDSQIRKDREAYYEWLIKNNPDSLKLIVLFGGAAKDAFAEFLISRGAEVPTRLEPSKLDRISVPVTKLVPAGGNNEFPVPITKEGKDVYKILLGKRPDYKTPKGQQEALNAVKNQPEKAMQLMVFTGGGAGNSGIIHAAQLGGYDLSKVKINGVETISLKGLRLSDGTIVEKDMAFVESTHPTALSKLAMEKGNKAASDKIKQTLNPLELLKSNGWYIEPDVNSFGKKMVNEWHAGKDFDYGRGEVGASFFEFGAPDDRRANQSSAVRDGAQVILAGTKDKSSFNDKAVDMAKTGLPSDTMDPRDLWSIHPRTGNSRYVFDRGPGPEIAEKLYTSIDLEKLFEPKSGMKVTDARGRDLTFEKNGIDAYNTKTYPGTGLFGFHRGSFQNSEALILADPHGVDDWNTARALTGARGQYLNGMMSDLGIGEKYLVIKTVPVGMDGATASEWETVRQQTEKYREVAIAEALKNKTIKYIFTDGPIAKVEMERVLNKMGVSALKVIDIRREGMDPKSGIAEAAVNAQKTLNLAQGKNIAARMKDIPRAHLTWWSRAWEGTTGDRVIEASGKERGKARALVNPNWVFRQTLTVLDKTVDSVKKLKANLEANGLRSGQESYKDYFARKGITGGLNGKQKKILQAKATQELNVMKELTEKRMRSAAARSCEAVFQKAAGQ